MDFKVAGTKEFVTALQLDTKLDGIPAEVLAGALTQARDARLHILDVMAEAIDAPDEMSPYAPRDHHACKIPVDKIGEVIGPKGKMINQIQDDTGAQISIEDDGTIYIGADRRPVGRGRPRDDQRDRQPDDAGGRRALPRHRRQDDRPSVRSSRCCRARTACCTSPRCASSVGGKRIDNVEDVVNVGQKIQVEITEIDHRGKLSLAAVIAEPEADSADAAAPAATEPADA